MLAELGVDARVIPLPVSPTTAVRADNNQTLLALGVIRPYKGLADAIEVTRRLPDARLLVAGDPAMPLDGLRDAPRTEWRLGYLPEAELDRALSESTLALFPYRARARPVRRAAAGPRRGSAGGRLRRRRAGEPIRRYGAGRVVPAGDVDGAHRSDPRAARRRGALAAARAGADRARAELTWDAAAAAHLALYRELA